MTFVSSAAALEADTHNMEESHVQHRRSAPHLKAIPLSEEDTDSRANLSELLARLISTRKGVCFCVFACSVKISRVHERPPLSTERKTTHFGNNSCIFFRGSALSLSLVLPLVLLIAGIIALPAL